MASIKFPTPNPDATVESARKKSVFYTLPPDSRTPARFLPPTEENGGAFTVIHNHFNLKDEKGDDISFGCLKEEKGEHCPACALADHLFSTGDQIDKNLAYKVKAKPRYYGQYYIKGQESDGPKLTGFAPTMADKIASIGQTLKDSELPQYNDIKGGQIVTLIRKGSGLNTDYDAMITGQTIALDDFHKEWEGEVNMDVYARVKPRFGTPAEMIDALRRAFGGDVDVDTVLGGK
jgi:hypothetical protein